MENKNFGFESCSHKFTNGFTVVNTTPHPLTFLDGEEVVVVENNPSVLVNARAVEERVNSSIVQTKFYPDGPGKEIVRDLIGTFREEWENQTLKIVGSVIAANAYPEVVGMCPAPGFERKPPQEKRMSCEKFNSGDIYPDFWKEG